MSEIHSATDAEISRLSSAAAFTIKKDERSIHINGGLGGGITNRRLQKQMQN